MNLRKLTQQYAYYSLQMHEAVSKKSGLPGTDHKYLGFLLTEGKMTAGQLSKLSGLTTGAVTGLIDRFEKRGLVKRVYAEDDRRKVLIEPNTRKIMEMIAPLYRDFRDKSEKLNESFPDKDLKVIESYFEKSIAIIIETIEDLNKKA